MGAGSGLIGPSGGEVRLDGATGTVTIRVPPGALASEQQIVVTETAEPSPEGYEVYSAVYRFEPEGLTFDRPVEVTMTHPGTSTLAAVFWSREGSPGYERLGGVPSAGGIRARVAHFSTGFVANGVDYAEAPERSCVASRLVEGRSVMVGGVALSFTADDCQGRPVAGLTAADLEVAENGVPVTDEVAILPQHGLTAFATLVLDLSPSTAPAIDALVDGASAFVRSAKLGAPVQIGLEVFGGEGSSTVIEPPTLDADLLLRRIAELRAYRPATPGPVDLNGAVLDSLTRLDAAMGAFRARNFGGATTLGFSVVFTTAGDTAGLHAVGEIAAAKAAHGDLEVFVVSSSSADEDRSALREVASRPAANGFVETFDPSTLARDFQSVAASLRRQLGATYLLGYCSPSREGSPVVSVRLRGAESPTSAEWRFDADGLTSGCAVGLFQSACVAPDARCGGLACGACDDRAETCDEASGTCVSYCAVEESCGGRTLTNPLGYDQVCSDRREATACSAATCSDLRSDPANCGACGVSAPLGGDCQDGQPTCPTGQFPCDGRCVASDIANCGQCGRTCSGSTPFCVDDACERSPRGFVLIPAGVFTMGSPPEELGRDADEVEHRVTVSASFWMKATEVTLGDWTALMGTSRGGVGSTCSPGPDRDRCPVAFTAWDDALLYANALSRAEGLPECYRGSAPPRASGQTGDWTYDGLVDCLGYRLPTEAEWEYAARAGTTGRYGDASTELDAVGWCGLGSVSAFGPYPVGQKGPNAWGLYDMFGNVEEWVHDAYGPYDPNVPVDPVGSSAGRNRVMRGGTWRGSAAGCRAASRNEMFPASFDEDLGFRVVRTIP